MLLFLATFVLRNLATGHFYLAKCEKMWSKSEFLARKCGQLATFEKKCGHEICSKIVKNRVKTPFFGHF